ncbi:MAG: 3-phosphoglycerate dehydrogenase [Tissierellaceae bacterium]|nr:3-phosphoglycerate dehydrogenase [Tissierellaceae bacterium]
MKEIEKLKQQGWEIHLNDTGKSYSHEEFVKYAKDVDGIIIGVDIADREMLKSCKNLKAIAKYGVGVDNIDLDTAKELGIKISRTVGSNSVSVAEHTIALMFACAKRIVDGAINVKNGKWNKNYEIELMGKKIGIIGFGNIGRHVSRLAQGIGMNVCAYDVFPINEKYAKEHNIQICSLDELVRTSDVITIHTPLTPETKDMINAERLKEMKTTAIVINAARGGIINEADLYEALVNKEIFAAGFDVFSTEPPKTDEKLLRLDNFILTPHTASKTLEADMNTIKMSITNLITDIEG